MDQRQPAEVADRPPADPPPRHETDGTIAADADRQVRGLRFALAFSIAVALGVVLTALSIQSGRILDAEGHGWPFSLLYGPFNGETGRQGWRVVSDPSQFGEQAARYGGLLLAFTLVDFAYIAAYAYLLAVVIAALVTGRWRRTAYALLVALVVVDVAENVCSLAGPSGLRPGLIASLTLAKWLLLVALVGLLVLATLTSAGAAGDRGLRARLHRIYRAVTHQRFAFVPMIALFVLSVLSGTPILEQLPDVLRRWISDGGTGLRHAAVSMIITLSIGAALVVAGQYRSGYAYRHPPLSPDSAPTRDDPRTPPRLWIWLVGPVVVGVGLLVTLFGGRMADVLGGRLLIFTLVPVVLIAGLSRLLRGCWQTPDEREESRSRLQAIGVRVFHVLLRESPAGLARWLRSVVASIRGHYRVDRPPDFDDRTLTAVRLAGWVGGLGTVVVGGLSLVRAFVPLLLVPQEETGADLWLVGGLIAIGLSAVVVPWLVAIRVVRVGAARRTARLGTPAGPATKPERAPAAVPWRSMALLGTGLGLFTLLGVHPPFARWIGVAATANLALGSMALMLSAVALIIQDRPTAEVFRWVGLRRSPLVSLLVLTLVLLTAFGGDDSIHGIRRGTPLAAPVDRPDLTTAFGRWLASPTACTVTVNGQRVRPMVLVAAEGGGIRAAYWTVLGLRAIDEQPCGTGATLLSAGASGGSVGLTVARFSDTAGDPGAAVHAVEQMAEPDPLADGANGTFVRDLVYGASGVPVHRLGEPDWAEWKDRARLIEEGWARTGGADGRTWGDRPFLTPGTELSPSTGHLVLNTTDVKHSCRVWLSQLDLAPPVAATDRPSYDPERSCDKNPGPAPRTIDLFSAYGGLGPAPSPTCLDGMDSVTAALLTARFPYVTPSAVVGPCPSDERAGGRAAPYWPQTQLVDGGYIENTGLATITDLSDDWLGAVRRHNTTVLTAKDPAQPLVVPLIVFLTNGDRSVVQPVSGSSPVSELVVPPLTYLRGAASLSGSEALLQRARAAVELDGFCPALGNPTCTAVDDRFRSRVVVVDRATRPEIGAPLGWVMSQASINAMRYAMTEAARTTCAANRPRSAGGPGPADAPDAPDPADPVDQERQPGCRTGYATLGDLFGYFSAVS